MLVEPILCKNSWIWTPLGPQVKFWTCFPTWASNRNLNFQEKLQNRLCSCTSWSNVWHTIEMFDTYPESSWYKLLENTRKNWNNHKSYFTILDKNTQKRILCMIGKNKIQCPSWNLKKGEQKKLYTCVNLQAEIHFYLASIYIVAYLTWKVESWYYIPT